MIVIECGVCWVPPLLWRMDAEYRALRKEVPWVKRLPSEYFTDHIRFTSQPLEQAPKREHLHAVLEAMNARQTLMFASDYPHWDQDEVREIERALPDGWAPDVFGLNALKVYDRLAHFLPQAEAQAREYATAGATA